MRALVQVPGREPSHVDVLGGGVRMQGPRGAPERPLGGARGPWTSLGSHCPAGTLWWSQEK